jgi:hypothetical protein
VELDEIQCNIDEDFDNENCQGKNNIHNSFINKLKDFSTFNPSGNKGKEKLSTLTFQPSPLPVAVSLTAHKPPRTTLNNMDRYAV